MSNSNRFVDNQDGTLTDTKTTLMWVQEDGWQREGKWFSWDDAKDWAIDMSGIKFDFKNGETRPLYKSKTGRMSVRLVRGDIPR